MKHDQIMKTGGLSPSGMVEQSSQSQKEAFTSPCLQKDQEYVLPYSSFALANEINQAEDLANEQDIPLILPSTLPGKIDGYSSYRPMDCSEVLGNTALINNSSDMDSTLSRNKKGCRKVTLSQNSLIVVQPGNPKRRVTFSEESKHCCHGDHSLRGSRENVSQLLTPGNVSQESIINSDGYLVTALIRAGGDHSDQNSLGVSSLYVKFDSLELDPSNPQDEDKQSIPDVTGYTLSCPGPTVSHVCCHAVIRVAREDSRLCQVLFGQKEKLTRRQMVQLGGMMALGFICVILILVWVFSPVLF